MTQKSRTEVINEKVEAPKKKAKWKPSGKEIKRREHPPVYSMWVTKYVTRREWNEIYLGGKYTIVSEARGGYIIGFMIADMGEKPELPMSCQKATEEQKRIIKKHCESNNWYPQPVTLL